MLEYYDFSFTLVDIYIYEKEIGNIYGSWKLLWMKYALNLFMFKPADQRLHNQ